MNRPEILYERFVALAERTLRDTTPYLRRIIRLLALPYAFVALVNWKECAASRLRVAMDLAYVFFWLKYFPDNYSFCRLWEKPRADWDYYYGSAYDPYQRARLEKEVQRPDYRVLFSDKDLCSQMCQEHGIPVPESLGCLLPSDDYRDRLRTAVERVTPDRLIAKPLRGAGGRGIRVIEKEDGRVFVTGESGKQSLDSFILDEPVVVERFIRQDPRLSAVAPCSVNSAKITTLLTRERSVLVLGAFLKFGTGDRFVDNLAAGGVASGIHLDSGRLYDVGFDKHGSPHRSHPDSGVLFSDFSVPGFEEMVRLVVRAQLVFHQYRMLGFDVAQTERGPLIIEINEAPDIVVLEGLAGPILRDPGVLRAFADYDLLINEPQRRLFRKSTNAVRTT